MYIIVIYICVIDDRHQRNDLPIKTNAKKEIKEKDEVHGEIVMKADVIVGVVIIVGVAIVDERRANKDGAKETKTMTAGHGENMMIDSREKIMKQNM